MDPKAAAKSKRSHTVHGRRAHQTPAAAHKQKRAASSSSAPAAATSPRTGTATTPRATRRTPRPPRNGPARWRRAARAPTSPSCWSRRGRSPARPGALARRGSPPRTRHLASTSMFEAKGEGILSWCADDNFILEDDLAPDFEVPFLSMDLNALANQLSKLKLSQRLFIEEDLLPEDLADASEDNGIPIECDTSVGTDAKGLIEPKKDVSHHEYASSICSDDQMKTRHQSQCFEQKATTSPKIGTQVGQSKGEEDKSYTRIMDTESVTGHSKGLKFKVSAAEEELDMLLNSFSGTHLSNSNVEESFGHDLTLQGTEISESKEKVTPIMFSKSPALAPVDDALDDLLSEISLSVQNENFATPSLNYQPTSKSGHNIDFRYAKKIDVTSIDDSVDDLLEDTLSCLNEQKQNTSAQGQNNTSNDIVPPHSAPSNASDDFDSWFDSL